MAKYEVKVRSFLNGSIVEEGTIIEFDDRAGKPGPHMVKVEEPTKEGAKAPKKAEADLV